RGLRWTWARLSGGVGDVADGLQAAQESVVDRVGRVGRGLPGQERDRGRIVRMQDPDDEEAARAGIDRSAQRGRHLLAAVTQRADGVRGRAPSLLPFVRGEERRRVAPLLLAFP